MSLSSFFFISSNSTLMTLYSSIARMFTGPRRFISVRQRLIFSCRASAAKSMNSFTSLYSPDSILRLSMDASTFALSILILLILFCMTSRSSKSSLRFFLEDSSSVSSFDLSSCNFLLLHALEFFQFLLKLAYVFSQLGIFLLQLRYFLCKSPGIFFPVETAYHCA